MNENEKQIRNSFSYKEVAKLHLKLVRGSQMYYLNFSGEESAITLDILDVVDVLNYYTENEFFYREGAIHKRKDDYSNLELVCKFNSRKLHEQDQDIVDKIYENTSN